MSRLDRLTQWQSGGTSLRALVRAKKPGSWTGDADALAEHDTAAPSPDTDLALGAAGNSPPSPTALGMDLEAEAGEALLWGGDDSDESATPMEALPVYRVAGTWRASNGELRATVHGFASEAVYARGECVLGQGSLWQEAAALSLLSLPAGAPADVGVDRERRSTHDVRPHLLLLLHAQDSRALGRCLHYGRNYLAAWCARNAIPASPAAIDAAAVDGLTFVYRCREPTAQQGRRTPRLATPTASARAREIGMRNEDFARLRAVVAQTYLRRLAEAEALFLACADYVAPKTGTSAGSAHAPETWWHPERLTRKRQRIAQASGTITTH